MFFRAYSTMNFPAIMYTKRTTITDFAIRLSTIMFTNSFTTTGFAIIFLFVMYAYAASSTNFATSLLYSMFADFIPATNFTIPFHDFVNAITISTILAIILDYCM